MKPILAIALVVGLSACNTLGGVPPEALNAMANAGAGCVRVTGVWGSGTFVTASADKGVIKNGSITVNPDTCALTIQEAKPVAPVKP